MDKIDKTDKTDKTDYSNKYSYLQSKFKKIKCANNCIELRKQYKKPIQCGICFWNNVTLPYENIPPCSRCTNDMKSFKAKLFQIQESKESNKKTILLKAECGKYCLWWDWFDNRRQSTCYDCDITLKYVRTEEKK